MSSETTKMSAPRALHGYAVIGDGEMPVPGTEYYWKRTDGWKWIDGEQRWWEVLIVFTDGMNGGGGAHVTELWRWNGSRETLRRQPRNLTLMETRELIAELVSA